MFEDSTFESMGRIRTRSRGWMIATFVFNASILLGMILIPLIYPQALSGKAMTFLMTAPPMPAEEPRPQVRPERAAVSPSEIRDNRIQAPPSIPTHIYEPDRPEMSRPIDVAGMIPDGGPAGPGGGIPGTGTNTTIVQAPMGPKTISSGVALGLLIHKVVPQYPAIPRTIRLEGTVVLQATISKNGTIENLHVVGGPALLQQAALDAVQQWRYRPYLLNGQPVEVETTINVEFKLN